MVIPVVAAAAARVAATSAARAAATNAARAGAQATIRTGTQAAARSAATGARATVTATGEGAAGEAGVARNTGGYAQNAAAERNTIQLGERPAESRAAGERGANAAGEVEQAQAEQAQIEQDSRTRDRRIHQSVTEEEEGEGEEGEEAEKSKPRMSLATLVGMLIVAFIFDAIQTLTALFVFGVITSIISYTVAFLTNILAWTIFIIWFGLCGMNILGGRKAVVAVVGFLADTALAGIVPYWTVTVLVAYFDEKLEEKGLGVSKVVSMLK